MKHIKLIFIMFPVYKIVFRPTSKKRMTSYLSYPSENQTSPYTTPSRYMCRICGQAFASPYTHYLHINYTCPNIPWRLVDAIINRDPVDSFYD